MREEGGGGEEEVVGVEGVKRRREKGGKRTKRMGGMNGRETDGDTKEIFFLGIFLISVCLYKCFFF